MRTQYTVEVRPKLNAQVVLYGEYYIESRSKSIEQEIDLVDLFCLSRSSIFIIII